MATAVETVKGFMNTLKKYSQYDSEIGAIALNGKNSYDFLKP